MFSRFRRKDAVPPSPGAPDVMTSEPVERKKVERKKVEKKKPSLKSSFSRKSKGRSSREKATPEEAVDNDSSSNSLSRRQPAQDPYQYSNDSPDQVEEEEDGKGAGLTAEAKFVSYFKKKRAAESTQQQPSNSYTPDTWSGDIDDVIQSSGDHLAMMAAASRKADREEQSCSQRTEPEKSWTLAEEEPAAVVEESAPPDMNGMSAEEQRRAKARMAVEDRKRKAREAVAARKAKAKAAKATTGNVSDEEEDDDGIVQTRREDSEPREFDEEEGTAEAAKSEKKRLLQEAETARQAQKTREDQEERDREEELARQEVELKQQQMELYKEELRLEEELRVAEERAREEEELRKFQELEEEERKLNEEMARLEAEAEEFATAQQSEGQAIQASEDWEIEMAEKESKAEEDTLSREKAEEEARLEEERQKVEEARIAAEKLADEQFKLAEAARIAAEKLAAENLAAEKLAAENLAAEKLAAENLAAEKLAAEQAKRAEEALLALEKFATDKGADENVYEDVEPSETDLSALLDGDDSILDREGSPVAVSPTKIRGGLRSSLTKILAVGKKKNNESPVRRPNQKAKDLPIASSTVKSESQPVVATKPIKPSAPAASEVSSPRASQLPKRSGPKSAPSPKRTTAPQDSLPPPAIHSAPPSTTKSSPKNASATKSSPKNLTVETKTSPPKIVSILPGATPARSTPLVTFKALPRAFPNSPARSVDSTGSISSIDHIPRSPFMKARDDQEPEPVCRHPYVPGLHVVKGPCQVCAFRLSEAERARLELNGRSLLVNSTAGGCIDCETFPPMEGADPVRICKKCFFDTHLPPERHEEAFSGTGALAGIVNAPRDWRRRFPAK